jgi:hypothetical protein
MLVRCQIVHAKLEVNQTAAQFKRIAWESLFVVLREYTQHASHVAVRPTRETL